MNVVEKSDGLFYQFTACNLFKVVKKRCRNDLTRRKKGRLFLLNVDLILVVLFDYSSARLFTYVNQSVWENTKIEMSL